MTDGGGPATSIGLAVLIDFDGTIARSDVSDEVMRRYAPAAAWGPLEAAYLDGAIGSRTLLTRQAALLDGGIAEIATFGADEALDPRFAPFVTFVRGRGAVVEVVSDGFGFFVERSLARVGMGDLPVFTAQTAFTDERVRIAFPDGHPDCRVCGTCKRQRILLHQRAGRYTVFVGDGFSDLYAAHHADLVFAKDHLATLCADRDLPFRPWRDFGDIERAVADLLANGVPAPRPRPFVCGPEAWPPGTDEPLWSRPPVRHGTHRGDEPDDDAPAIQGGEPSPG